MFLKEVGFETRLRILELYKWYKCSRKKVKLQKKALRPKKRLKRTNKPKNIEKGKKGQIKSTIFWPTMTQNVYIHIMLGLVFRHKIKKGFFLNFRVPVITNTIS